MTSKLTELLMVYSLKLSVDLAMVLQRMILLRLQRFQGDLHWCKDHCRSFWRCSSQRRCQSLSLDCSISALFFHSCAKYLFCFDFQMNCLGLAVKIFSIDFWLPRNFMLHFESLFVLSIFQCILQIKCLNKWNYQRFVSESSCIIDELNYLQIPVEIYPIWHHARAVWCRPKKETLDCWSLLTFYYSNKSL